MGRAHGRDHANTAHNMLKVCVSSQMLPYPRLICLQTAQACSTRHHSQRHLTSCANTRSMSCLCRLPLPQTARSTELRRLRVTHSHSLTSRTRSTAIASSCLQDGTVGERSVSYEKASTRKHGASHGNATCLQTPESTRRARPVRESCMRLSCRTRAPRYALSPPLPSSYVQED